MIDLSLAVNQIYPEIVSIRRDFHSHPELSEREKRTASKISSYLTTWNIPHQKKVGGYGIVAVIQGKKKRPSHQVFSTIGLRADIDALPICELVDAPFRSAAKGVMHACGHDLHTAILLGTAKILKSMEDTLPGTVKFFFQPAEETIGGAKAMIEAGHMRNPPVDAMLGLHVHPTLPSGTIGFCPGTMNAASSEFSVSVIGATCHGAHPDLGIDPILIACHILLALQSIVSRFVSPTESAVITVGKIHGGNKNNIIPPQVELSGIIRSLHPSTQEFLKEKVLQICTHTATAFGATAIVRFRDGYPALINDTQLVGLLHTIAQNYFPSEQVQILQEPSMGTDDFSYFCQAVRAAYFNLGTLSQDEKKPQLLHNPWFNPDESAMKAGMLMELAGVLELLQQD